MAGGGYPAAYRAPSRPLRVPSSAPLSSAANAARVPGTFPGLTPANQNAARIAGAGAGRFLPLAGRLVPLLGYALLLWEAWKLYQELYDQFAKQAGVTGWTSCQACPEIGGWTHAVPFASCVASECGTWRVFEYATVGQTTSAGYFALVQHDSEAGSGLFWGRMVETYVPNEPIAGPVPVPSLDGSPVGFLPDPHAEPLDLPAIIPQVLPEAAPAPGTPVPDPMPVPWAFVPWLPTESPTRAPIRGPSRPVVPRPNPYRNPRPRPTETPAEREERRRRAREREEKRRRRGPRPPRPTRPPMTEPRTPPLYIPFPEVPPLEEEETGALPGPNVRPDPGLSPELVPSSRLELRPGFKPRVSRTPHRRQKPGRRTRERKVILSWNNKLVFARGVNAATEFCDFVDALFDALPWEKRALYDADAFDPRLSKENWSRYSKAQKRSILQEHDRMDKQREAREAERPWWWRKPSDGMNVPCQTKAVAVLEATASLDMTEAVKNLVKNQIIDFVFGRAGKAAGEVGRAIGSPVGLGTGPAL